MRDDGTLEGGAGKRAVGRAAGPALSQLLVPGPSSRDCHWPLAPVLATSEEASRLLPSGWSQVDWPWLTGFSPFWPNLSTAKTGPGTHGHLALVLGYMEQEKPLHQGPYSVKTGCFLPVSHIRAMGSSTESLSCPHSGARVGTNGGISVGGRVPGTSTLSHPARSRPHTFTKESQL